MPVIGVFDSGAGGIAVIRELRQLSARADILFFRDRIGAPYGKKTECELIPLVEGDIRLLTERGADKILMACCTASTVWDKLHPSLRPAATPIILPTARRAAEITKTGKIGVIATEATVASRAFSRALHEINPSLSVTEWQTQELVSLVEGGARDESLTREEFDKIKAALKEVSESDIDTLILGCTHFPLVERTVSAILKGVRTVSSAREGARAMLPLEDRHGRIIYVENKPRKK